MRDRIAGSLDTQGAALELRARRQAVIAGNIANADTPGYRAVDFDFARALRERLAAPAAGAGAAPRLEPQAALQPAADGNTVELDLERAKFADNALRYEAALRSINGRIRTLLSVFQN